MKKLLALLFLVAMTVTILPAQKSKSMGNIYRNSDIHRYGFNLSEHGKIGLSYLGAIGTFVGTTVYANQTFPTTVGVNRTPQQNAVLIAGTTVTGALVGYGTYRLWRKNHR